MYKVIGFRETSFTTSDNTKISGYNVYCVYPLSGNGIGDQCERIFLSSRIVDESGFEPKLGQFINIIYNKYGKVASVEPAVAVK